MEKTDVSKRLYQIIDSAKKSGDLGVHHTYDGRVAMAYKHITSFLQSDNAKDIPNETLRELTRVLVELTKSEDGNVVTGDRAIMFTYKALGFDKVKYYSLCNNGEMTIM